MLLVPPSQVESFLDLLTLLVKAEDGQHDVGKLVLIRQRRVRLDHCITPTRLCQRGDRRQLRTRDRVRLGQRLDALELVLVAKDASLEVFEEDLELVLVECWTAGFVFALWKGEVSE